MVHTITGYDQISWRPIYNMYKPVALRANCVVPAH
jgi:hypothetical protein